MSSLSKQIKKFRLTADTRSYDLNIQNMSFRWEHEFYNEPKTSIGGKILASRSFAGKRLFIELRYDGNVQPLLWNAMVDDIMSDFIYNNTDSIDFYPDQSNRSDETVLTRSASANVTGGDTIDAGTTHGLSNGQYVEVSSTTIGGLSENSKYYVELVSTTEFKLSENIAGNPVTLTNATGKNLTLVENRFIEMVPDSVSEAQNYENTIGIYAPSLTLKSLKRFAFTPTVFSNV